MRWLVLSLAFARTHATDGLVRWHALNSDPSACHVETYGARGDNVTDDTRSIQTALDHCHAVHRTGAVIVFGNIKQARTYRIKSSIALHSNTTLLFAPKATMFSAVTPDMPIMQHPRCPTLNWRHGPTAILCGTNLTNVAVIGTSEVSSTIDGGGWPWYAAGVANHSMWGHGPRLFEVAWSTNVTLSQVRFINSPSWTVHPTFCNGVLAERIHIINPRFTPNTDGFDPDASVNVVLRDSVIDTGDDGISIKSSNSSEPGAKHVQMPSRNIHIYRVKILSRNVCVGSSTFGGVFNLLVEDCEIGDDAGSSPWAIKYKSHQAYPGAMVNHTWRRLRVGDIRPNPYQQPHAGYFMSVEMRYHPLLPNRTCRGSWECPLFENVSFEDISITGARRAGDLAGLPGDPLRGLRFRNVSFRHLPPQGWHCSHVDLKSFVAEDVSPPLHCTGDDEVHTQPGRPEARSSQSSWTGSSVVVFGATSAGVVAAIAAARSGVESVLLVAYADHVGGMLTGGLQHTDSANASVIGGITRELFVRIEEQYPGRPTNASYPPGHRPPGWLYESHVAQGVVEAMLREANVTLIRGAGGLRKPRHSGTRLVSVETDAGDELHADVFIDASYEGDLLASAGASMTWGREAATKYNESNAGRRPGSKLSGLTVNPYWDASVASPEALPHVSAAVPADIGAADGTRLRTRSQVSTRALIDRDCVPRATDWLEAYDFRLCFTNSPQHRIPFRRPAGYNASSFELWRRIYRAKPPRSLAEAGLSCLGPIPNSYGDCGKEPCRKCDMLGMDHGTDLTNGAWGYPNGTRAEREAIRRAHIEFTEGLLWFWKTDPAVPTRVQNELAQYGHCADEYSATSMPPHWPPQLYVREARRLVGDFVWTEHRAPEAQRARSVGLGSYTFDCHTVSRIIHRTGSAHSDYVVVEGRVNDGAEGRHVPGVVQQPFEIPYDALLPKVTEGSNLLAAVAVSASHLRYNAVRMEPTWMVIGQAAGVAAAMVVGTMSEPQPLHDLDVTELQRRLQLQGQHIWP